MRAYFFGNFYLSSIQQGIQALHCTTELFSKYKGVPDHISTPEYEKKRADLYEWGREHKTVILLNGGDSTELYAIRYHLEQEENPYPFAMFEESVDALSGAVTCVGIILPERVYEAAAELRKAKQGNYLAMGLELSSRWEAKLCEIMNSCGLAR